MVDIAPEYVAARSVLLDALTALEDHLDNVILVGAQAVYHHTGDTTLNVPVMTTDADLALDINQLSDQPEISSVLEHAGFAQGDNPGHWVGRGDVAVDLMVVPHQSGTDRKHARGARIAPHERSTARITAGLEPSLVDHTPTTITSFEPEDTRTAKIRVAGPAALLIAKAIKISERLDQADQRPDRLKEKDALDAFRLLQVVQTVDLVTGIKKHLADEHARTTCLTGLEVIRQHGLTPEGVLPRLAASAALDDPTIAPAFATLATQLIDAL